MITVVAAYEGVRRYSLIALNGVMNTLLRYFWGGSGFFFTGFTAFKEERITICSPAN